MVNAKRNIHSTAATSGSGSTSSSSCSISHAHTQPHKHTNSSCCGREANGQKNEEMTRNKFMICFFMRARRNTHRARRTTHSQRARLRPMVYESQSEFSLFSCEKATHTRPALIEIQRMCAAKTAEEKKKTKQKTARWSTSSSPSLRARSLSKCIDEKKTTTKRTTTGKG